MSMNQARFGLMGVFLVSLILQLGTFFLVRERMWPEEFQGLVLKVLAIYSVQLGVVLGGIFAQPRTPLANPPRGLAWSALLLAALWNMLLLVRSISFGLAAEDSAADLMKYVDGVGSGGAFLVAGVLAFFFGKGTEAAGSTSDH
jgi:hypothetical protein